MDRFPYRLSRRQLLSTSIAGVIAGCTSTGQNLSQATQNGLADPDDLDSFDPEIIYRAVQDGGENLPAVNLRTLKPRFHRQMVQDPTGETPGTIVVRLSEAHLYFVGNNGTAIRYGVGIGRTGYSWSGAGRINHQLSWPRWTPPIEMQERVPELKVYRNGMAGGLHNPLGARALYIHSGGRDTLYRVHGTPEWWTIGRAMSSGCIRMINQDVIDLATRVQPRARIIVS